MSILKKRSDNSSLKATNLLNKKNIFGDKNLKLSFKSNIKSVDIPNIYFNNYFKGNDSYYSFFKKEYSRIINGNFDIETYNIKGLSLTKNNLYNRISKVFLETYGYTYRLPYLHRISKKNNEIFQIIYTDDNYEIIIVDLYHLLIPAIDHEHKEKNKNLKKHYDEVKNNKYNLNNIFN